MNKFDIVLEVARKIYKSGKWKPMSGKFINWQTKYCCPIGAYCINEGYNNQKMLDRHGGYLSIIESKLNITQKEIWGFVLGFDNIPNYLETASEKEMHRIGCVFREEIFYDYHM